jgi:hypothetical protein
VQIGSCRLPSRGSQQYGQEARGWPAGGVNSTDRKLEAAQQGESIVRTGSWRPPSRRSEQYSGLVYLFLSGLIYHIYWQISIILGGYPPPPQDRYCLILHTVIMKIVSHIKRTVSPDYVDLPQIGIVGHGADMRCWSFTNY